METFPFAGSTTTTPCSLAGVGWMNNVPTGPDRLVFNNLNNASANHDGVVDASEPWDHVHSTAFYYVTTSSSKGVSGMTFPTIEPSEYPAVAFSVDVSATNSPLNVAAYFAVQMNGEAWYANSTPIPVDTSSGSPGFKTYQQQFLPDADLWNNLTLNSTGAKVGGKAAGNLAGKITGTGLVVVNDSTSPFEFDNFAVTTNSVPPIAPGIVSMPKSQSVYAGGGVSLQIVASGTQIRYVWEKGGVALANSSRISGANEKTLAIADASASDAGEYSCVISNSAGAVDSAGFASVTLTVDPVPAGLLYAEAFPVPWFPTGQYYTLGTVGWEPAATGGLYSNDSSTNAVWFYAGGPTTNVFYVTTASDTGVSGLPFKSIDVAANAGLTFSAVIQAKITVTKAYFAVQMNGNRWFVSATSLPTDADGNEKRCTQSFAPGANNWNSLTIVGGNGTVGAPAASDLTGSITGAGMVFACSGIDNVRFGSFSIFKSDNK